MNDLAKKAARKLRKDQTASEKIFWEAVRKRRIDNLRFLRQFPIIFNYCGRKRFFIADFYCAEIKLIVEIDGKIHEKQKDYDDLREHIIGSLGYRIIRFTNEELEESIVNVIKKLRKKISKS